MRLVAQTLETSYMYQLFARMYGTDNLPDSSNMCHESTSVGLKEAIGVGVGTVRLEDFEKTDLMFFFGQNVGTNSPRMLHPLQEARKRGVPIITFNPLREPGLLKFSNPQSPVEMMHHFTHELLRVYFQCCAKELDDSPLSRPRRFCPVTMKGRHHVRVIHAGHRRDGQEC
jgi:hypothetical protein